MRTIRVLIVDDHQVVREGLRIMLSSPEIEIVGQAASGEEAVEQAELLQPDVILMDLRMPGEGGISACRQIHERWPDIRIVAVTTFCEENLITGAMEAGAVAYILKDTPMDELGHVVRTVFRGGTVFSSGVASMALRRSPVPVEKIAPIIHTETTHSGSLTDREREILQLMGRGLDNHQIAQALFISPGTVRNAVSYIYTKLDVRDRAQAVVWAMEHGITRRTNENR